MYEARAKKWAQKLGQMRQVDLQDHLQRLEKA
jgi:hypothetical protein